MNRLLHDILFEQCFVYIDDIIIFGETEEECIQHTKNVLDRVFGDGLKLGALKCEFLLTKVDVLGYVIEDGKLYPKCDKLQGLYNLKVPTCRTDVKRLYGLLSFFRRFVRNFSAKSKPITDQMSVGDDIQWTEAASNSVRMIVDEIVANGLMLPDFDRDFILTTDFSYNGLGGMLS